jgi:hypothetical protein
MDGGDEEWTSGICAIEIKSNNGNLYATSQLNMYNA